MKGILRIIQNETSHRSHRIVLMRRSPSESMIEDMIGGKIDVIDGFDTILHEGGVVPCLALRARKDWEMHSTVVKMPEPIAVPNALANMLWLQALLRQTGFSSLEGRKTPDTITGPIVILYGDDSYMGAVLETLLQLNQGCE